MEQVTAGRARQVAALYDDLSMTPPPETNQRERIAASRSRNFARQRGWAPPLAWDDIDNDEAPATVDAPPPREADVDHAVVQRFLDSQERPKDRRFSHEEAALIVHALRQRGLSHLDMKHLGLKPDRYPERSST
jgi:hypothetical protein